MANAKTQVTKETRRESYENVRKNLGERQKQCFDGIVRMGGNATSNELARHLLAKGTIPYYNTNYTNPRLIELSELGLLEVVGKRKDAITNKNVAIYKVKEQM